MDLCATCRKTILKKTITCNFCVKYFCGLSCLMKHSSMHSKFKNLNSDNPKNILVKNLKDEQSKNEIEKYHFLTPGIFTEKYKYDPEYDLSNFIKEYNGFIPRELGIGSYGRVYLVKNKFTNKNYALKEINKNKLINIYGDCKLVKNEVEIHSKLKHPNIIRLYNMQETKDEILILLEYAENGNLFEIIQKEKGLNESKAYEYFIQIINAVYFLHQNNIIHRDIKPENILLGENGILKLCDFGWAKELNVNNRMTFCGTMEYMAPEIVGCENYDFGVDIWALGILLYELIMGHSPFRDNKDRNIMIKIKKHDLIFDKDKNISSECIDLINRLLDENPTTRLKLKDILNHPFILVHSKEGNKNKLRPRKESLDDSNENIIKFFKRKEVPEKFVKLRNKFGFENDIYVKDKLSSKKLFFNEFMSDKKSITIKDQKINRKESKKLEKIVDKMSSKMDYELEIGKKNFDNLNFTKGKQLSFEDFRDSEILKEYDNKNKNKIMKLESNGTIDLRETKDNTYCEKSEEDEDDDGDDESC